MTAKYLGLIGIKPSQVNYCKLYLVSSESSYFMKTFSLGLEPFDTRTAPFLKATVKVLKFSGSTTAPSAST